MPKHPAHVALLVALVLAACPGGPLAEAKESDSQPPYTEVDRINAGLPDVGVIDLGTPQAALENFILSCDRRDYAAASHSMNLNAIPPGRQAEAGAILARHLKEVMDRQVWFRWDEVPDRADGAIDEASLKKEADDQDGPQASLKLGTLYIGDRDFEIRLERLKPAERTPIWVFSGQTVKHIPALHAEFGPTWVERYLPEILKREKFAKIRLWQWIGFGLFAARASSWVGSRRRASSSWAVWNGPGSGRSPRR